jgi:hypothetical protein
MMHGTINLFNVLRINLRNFSVEADFCLNDISKGLLAVKLYFPKSWKRCFLNTLNVKCHFAMVELPYSKHGISVWERWNQTETVV